MKYLRPYFRHYRKESILAPLFKMLEAGFDLLVPLVVAHIINIDIPSRSSGLVVRDVLLMVLMAVLGLACSFTAQYFAAQAGSRSHRCPRRKILGRKTAGKAQNCH